MQVMRHPVPLRVDDRRSDRPLCWGNIRMPRWASSLGLDAQAVEVLRAAV
jgi:hypothetical protein